MESQRRSWQTLRAERAYHPLPPGRPNRRACRRGGQRCYHRRWVDAAFRSQPVPAHLWRRPAGLHHRRSRSECTQRGRISAGHSKHRVRCLDTRASQQRVEPAGWRAAPGERPHPLPRGQAYRRRRCRDRLTLPCALGVERVRRHLRARPYQRLRLGVGVSHYLVVRQRAAREMPAAPRRFVVSDDVVEYNQHGGATDLPCRQYRRIHTGRQPAGSRRPAIRRHIPSAQYCRPVVDKRAR
jgi:hypothetical protein